MENCTKFGQFILSKIIKIVDNSCQILSVKCTKFDFGFGSAPDPAGGAHSAPPDLLAAFRAYFKRRGRGGRGGEREGKRGGEGKGGREGKGKGR